MGSLVAIGIHVHTGAVTRRPLRATHPARVHLALLGSLALLLLAWRLHLATFSAELTQAHPGQSQAFPGPHYVDAHVRLLGLRLLSYVAVVSAIGLAAAPFLASRGRVFAARRAAIFPVAALVVIAIVSESWAPTLLQRYVVNTNPVAREAPFLEHSIAGTRHAFGLAGVDVHQFVPKARITSADIRHDRSRLDNVQLWDTNILRLQMQQLSSKTPFYRPGQPTLDATPSGGGSPLTVIGERELDVQHVQGAGRGRTRRSWSTPMWRIGLGVDLRAASGRGALGSHAHDGSDASDWVAVRPSTANRRAPLQSLGHGRILRARRSHAAQLPRWPRRSHESHARRVILHRECSPAELWRRSSGGSGGADRRRMFPGGGYDE